METIDTKRISIDPNLFDFAYIPGWLEQLHRLSLIAIPEPWRYAQPLRETMNAETPILERYINSVFRKLAIDYSYARNQAEADLFIHARNEFICLHTGLYTQSYKGIYMCFERNKRPNVTRQWYFKAFVDEGSGLLKYVTPLPPRPVYQEQQNALRFEPEWSIRINAEHILTDPENVGRLPESIRDAWNLPLLLEVALEFARRRAFVEPDLVSQQIFAGQIQYLLPICITNMVKPDLAMALSDMNGYYVGHTCLTLDMAYQNARLLAQPTAKWLTDLLAHPDPPKILKGW